MNFKGIEQLNVYYLGMGEKYLMGELAVKNRAIYFQYDPDFLKKQLMLSPFKLPLKREILIGDSDVFEGLFGVFNDSLPDGWGRLLLDRKLIKMGINIHQLSPLDRLAYVGQHGMGALSYEPALQSDFSFSHINLDEIAEEVMSFQEGNDDQYVDELLRMNGSSAGARPKILVNLVNEKFTSATNKEARNPWIIKFRSSFDLNDQGSIEYAYHLMAKSAKLDVPQARLFKSKKYSGFFGVQRFDRKNSQPIHMHTLSGLLHADHRLPNLDYEAVIKVTSILTKNIHENEKQLRAALFNILTHNRDDHAKNFSFLMNNKGEWSVSPAYDLTFSSGPAGEHCTTLFGEGRQPTYAAFLKLATLADITNARAHQIVEEVQTATTQWRNFAEEAGVSKKSTTMIQKAMESVKKHFR